MTGAMVLKLVEQGVVGACVLGAALAVVVGFLALVSWLWTKEWFLSALAWTVFVSMCAGVLGGAMASFVMIGQVVFP